MFNVNNERQQVTDGELARKFIDRLTRSTTDDKRTVPGGEKVTTAAPRGKKPTQDRDPVYAMAMDRDPAQVKKDVGQAMTKIKKTLVALRDEEDSDSEDLTEELEVEGRDRRAYATFAFRNKKMGELVDSWDESWPIEKTAGLLLDIGLAVKDLRGERQDQQGEPKELLSDILTDSRSKVTKRIDRNSKWIKENFVPKEASTHSGASATTAHLLMMLEEMDVPLTQVEAILNGVIGFWNNPWWIKRLTGNYHTAAEVWAVWNEHLETRLADQWKTAAVEEEQQRKRRQGQEQEQEQEQEHNAKRMKTDHRGDRGGASDGGDMDINHR